PHDHYKILDATAGWGRDSFILASLGFEVTMIERSPIVAVLLKDALKRAANNEACKRMHLIQDDAVHYLQPLAEKNRPDVIYLDPMFPARKKSALVKKEMALLQTLLDEPNTDE